MASLSAKPAASEEELAALKWLSSIKGQDHAEYTQQIVLALNANADFANDDQRTAS